MKVEAAEAPPPPYATAAAGDLPDVNVWLALAVEEHPHHAPARSYWEHAPRLWFNRVTMLALVRLLCQPKVMGPAALNLAAACAAYRRFAQLPGVGLLAEPASCDRELLRLAATPGLAPRLWTDAYLAAFAIAGGVRLVTFDADFDRFEALHCLRLRRP